MDCCCSLGVFGLVPRNFKHLSRAGNIFPPQPEHYDVEKRSRRHSAVYAVPMCSLERVSDLRSRCERDAPHLRPVLQQIRSMALWWDRLPVDLVSGAIPSVFDVCSSGSAQRASSVDTCVSGNQAPRCMQIVTKQIVLQFFRYGQLHATDLLCQPCSQCVKRFGSAIDLRRSCSQIEW